MSQILDKKGVLITGGAQRLGKAMAMFLAGNGYDVAIHYNISKDHAIKTKDIIENLYNRQCILIQADLTEFNSLNSIIDKTFQSMPYCNCLINNASVFYKNTLMNTSIEDFSYNYDLHIKAPLFLTQYFAKKCTTIGNIINIIDAIVTKNATKSFTYTMSKKSLSDFTKFAAVELSPNIKVNAIGPRMILDDFLNNINHKNIMDNTEVKHILTTIEKLLDPNNQETGTIIIMP
ncbi:Putative Dehydrogenases with different specificit ies (Related to short-chain alcohol dehydrogenases) [Ehrlichia minasensis]|nr:Putative Dehydrogenases with different specificit ies (Related to short-chain alcohol dehydrogenases) [Ehrlichia minasensis]